MNACAVAPLLSASSLHLPFLLPPSLKAIVAAHPASITLVDGAGNSPLHLALRLHPASIAAAWSGRLLELMEKGAAPDPGKAASKATGKAPAAHPSALALALKQGPALAAVAAKLTPRCHVVAEVEAALIDLQSDPSSRPSAVALLSHLSTWRAQRLDATAQAAEQEHLFCASNAALRRSLKARLETARTEDGAALALAHLTSDADLEAWREHGVEALPLACFLRAVAEIAVRDFISTAPPFVIGTAFRWSRGFA